jgi:hypothetical protein
MHVYGSHNAQKEDFSSMFCDAGRTDGQSTEKEITFNSVAAIAKCITLKPMMLDLDEKCETDTWARRIFHSPVLFNHEINEVYVRKS